MNSCSASEKDVRLTCFAFKIVVLRIKNPPFPRQKIWRQNGGKNLVSRFSNAEKTEFLIKKNSSNSEESEELCFRYTIDEHTSCRSGSDQLQNHARFCKMFSLPHGSRRRICPDRLLQNRSDTAGRFYSYDILKNCTFARGKQCTICSVVYCKRREYVVLFLIRKMDSIFGVSLKFIAYSILNVFSGGT